MKQDIFVLIFKEFYLQKCEREESVNSVFKSKYRRFHSGLTKE